MDLRLGPLPKKRIVPDFGIRAAVGSAVDHAMPGCGKGPIHGAIGKGKSSTRAITAAESIPASSRWGNVGIKKHLFRQPMSQAMNQAMTQAIDRVKSEASDRAPRAEAVAAGWIERIRPAWSRVSEEWRRIGTTAAVLLIAGLVLHVTFGANGMVVYRQKRAEMQSWQAEVNRLQQENDRYVARIKALKSDPAAIEKEAREQLHYTRRGEVVYVAPDPSPNPLTVRARNE